MVKVIFVLSLRFPARKEDINMCIEMVPLSNYANQTNIQTNKKEMKKEAAVMDEGLCNPCCKKQVLAWLYKITVGQVCMQVKVS